MTSKKRKYTVWTPANVVTVIRICLVPVFVVALLSPWPEWFGMRDVISNQGKSLLAACVFILISCTDWIDGYLARSRNEVSDFGKLMDPLADKILVAAALLALIELGVLPSWPVLIILAREFIVSGARMLAASKGIIIAASWYGKAKTVFQIIAIVLFLIKDSCVIPSVDALLHEPLYLISWAVMLIALVLTVLSMVDYLSKVWPFISTQNKSALVEDDDVVDASDSTLHAEAKQLVALAVEKNITISTAESLTGGMISTYLTSVPGSSSVVLGGVVSYAISVKEKTLNVDGSLLAEHGAVDGTVALQMAQGVKKITGSDLAISVTGIAGPGGAEPEKPVGTVFIGFANHEETGFEKKYFQGSREQIRAQTVQGAFQIIERLLIDS